ncbi:MAG: cysteine--tRNA ligase [Candidatus Moranbacteria bacterium CG23_combo_of_CG06-09_8_20_14_all_40_16]|nr:MAG: cysteine--tRNA ligase [Candidatus Moranbacteria bacterium CG23_combo_of_CG06-09_8_20_14_all_40_16]
MLKIYNTLTKKKEQFKPINEGKVSLYTCGPTVYDFVHLGNFKSYLTADILRRYLEYSGYEVRHIKNITDVGHLTEDDIAQGDSGEDKIAQKALSEKKTPKEVADFYEEYFKAAEKKLNILPAHYFPRATAHIPQMIKIIEKLLEKGLAYEKNGNVFFDVTKFPEYGKLSGNTLKNLKVGARLEEHPDKKNPWDFALWLKAPKVHLMKFSSPWSLGYPGWHIECTAMSLEYLGETIDIHTGGEDNIFPHHEAEIAQSESYTGQKFVNFWVHTRFLLVDGEKMSKSKHNFYKLEDVLGKGFSPMELRLALLSSQHCNQLNFSWNLLSQSRANLESINDFYTQLFAYEPKIEEAKLANFTLDAYKQEFTAAMDDDLNTPKALAVILKLVSDGNKMMAEKLLGNPAEVKLLLEDFAQVLGLILEKREIPEEIKQLAEERKKVRENKDFVSSDDLRQKIEKLGYLVEDSKDGEYIIKKK